MLKSLLVEKVFAVSSTEPVIGEVANIGTIGELLTWVTNLVIIVGFGLVVIFLAMGFIRFVTSQGDKEATATAQKWVSYAALGGVGLLLVYTIKAVLLSITGQEEPVDN